MRHKNLVFSIKEKTASDMHTTMKIINFKKTITRIYKYQMKQGKNVSKKVYYFPEIIRAINFVTLSILL